MSPWTHYIKWTYIKYSEDVFGVFWTSYVRSIYALCLGRLILLHVYTCWWYNCFLLLSIITPFIHLFTSSLFIYFVIAVLIYLLFIYLFIYLFNRLINHFCRINSVYTNVESDQNLFVSLMYTDIWLIIQRFLQNI